MTTKEKLKAGESVMMVKIAYQDPAIYEMVGLLGFDCVWICNEHIGTTPVGAYAGTLAACGAVDMWGNVWEWTSTPVGGQRAVKGGAWDSRRTKCRTESRDVGRDPKRGYANVGFRGVRETK